MAVITEALMRSMCTEMATLFEQMAQSHAAGGRRAFNARLMRRRRRVPTRFRFLEATTRPLTTRRPRMDQFERQRND